MKIMKIVELKGTENVLESAAYIVEREGKFYYDVAGTNSDGLAFESDDVGPFDSEAEAEEDARDYVARYNEEF